VHGDKKKDKTHIKCIMYAIVPVISYKNAKIRRAIIL